MAALYSRRPRGERSHVITLQKRLEGDVEGRGTRLGRCAGVVARGRGKTGTRQAGHGGASWPNKCFQPTPSRCDVKVVSKEWS